MMMRQRLFLFCLLFLMLDIFQLKDACLNLVYGNYTMIPKYTFVSLKMYTLDCVVSSIEYDAQSNRLYAVKSKPDPEIVYFEL